MGDRLGEAKASGNLGNTLKVMGRFDEAVLCCKRHLDISRELSDKVMHFLYSTLIHLLLCKHGRFGFPGWRRQGAVQLGKRFPCER